MSLLEISSRRARFDRLASARMKSFTQREWQTIVRSIREDRFGGSLLDDRWTQEDESILQGILTRISAGESWQYAVGYAYWYQWTWKVDSRALIPRSETEELLDWSLRDSRDTGDLSVLDIGTGSGILGVGFQLVRPQDRVCCVDKSPEALSLASENADRLGAKIDCRELDFLDRSQWRDLPKADVVLCNPPYIPAAESDQMGEDVLAHEPKMALFTSDDSGMEFYEAMREFGGSHLKPGGVMYMEINEFRAKQTMDLFAEAYDLELRQDMQGKDRMLKATQL